MIENRTFTREELLQIKGDTPVEGFRAFWEKQYADARNWKCSYTIESELWSPEKECRIYRFRFNSIDGFSIGGWLSRPAVSTGGALIAHGYGNPAIPSVVASPGRTSICPCVRGLGLSQCKEIPWQAHKHVIHGIGSRETYILRGVIADQWMAVRVLLDMFPDCADNLNYRGSSMGGGMGALMLPSVTLLPW